MKVTVLFWRDAPDHKGRWRFLGTPLGGVLALLGLAVVAAFFVSVATYVHDAYFPYEGEVVGLKVRWVDRFILESPEEEHLVIRTPAGKTIDRVVPMQIRIRQGIRIGDQVVKERGFRNRVRLRDEGAR
ncbi:hypothetical protein JXA88_12060 [Candidatus Fermentibacteria bacterium]|nr:hypothetical protein [Candidatus Fermentibacteria bacterium]